MNFLFGDNDSRQETATTAVCAAHPVSSAVVVLRSIAALLLVPLLIAGVGWLVLCCADFLPSARDGYELEWAFFALHAAAGSVLAPALLAAWVKVKEEDEGPDGNLRRLGEGCRAVLLSFGAFVPLFYASVALILFLLPDYRSFYTPLLLYKAGPPVFCLQLYISWKIAAFLLPPLVRDGRAPRDARFFFYGAWLLALLTLFDGAENGAMDLSGLAGGVLASPSLFYLLIAVAWLLVRYGIGCLRYLFALLCLFGPVGALLWLTPSLPPLTIALALFRAVLALTATLYLFLPSTRRWMV